MSEELTDESETGSSGRRITDELFPASVSCIRSDSIQSYGRNERDRRLGLILSSLSDQSKSQMSSEHSDPKMEFFRRTNQEKINFVKNLSLPHCKQCTLARCLFNAASLSHLPSLVRPSAWTGSFMDSCHA